MGDIHSGMDKSVPFVSVVMDKTDTAAYPRYELPEGYSCALYKPGMERAWRDVQLSVGHVADEKEADSVFREEFLADERRLARAMVFVLNARGDAVGTACLWTGGQFGRPLARVHWVAVRPEHQGKGLAKAMMTKLMDIYHELGLADNIYLTTQTWSYRAINVYLKFGFKPVLSGTLNGWDCGGYDSFEAQARAGWDIIDKHRV